AGLASLGGIGVTNSSLTFSSTAGGSDPVAQTVNITNSGGGALGPWVATVGGAASSWLTASPNSGTGAQGISVTASTSTLTAGNYTGTLTLSQPGVPSSRVTVNVTLTVALPQNTGLQYFASPGGSPSGDGSVSNPWDLQTALNQPSSVHPGDTIWLRGG